MNDKISYILEQITQNVFSFLELDKLISKFIAKHIGEKTQE